MSIYTDVLAIARNLLLPSGILAGRAIDTGERIIQYQEMASERSKKEFNERVYAFKSGKSTYSEATSEERQAWRETQKSKADGLLAIVRLAEHEEFNL